MDESTSSTKEQIAAYQQEILQASPDKQSCLKLQLAIAYLRDQEQEKAFQTFLSSLEGAPLKYATSSAEEKALYEEALKTYLDQSNVSIAETAETILNKYGPVITAHPTYTSLKLIVAIAKANLSLFEAFFVDFYDAYQYHPDHHLSYKTKAILHIKLFERAKTQEEKEQHRAQILELVNKSMDRYPADRSLYKMAIAFAPDGASRREAVVKLIGRIIDQNIMIPRCDILFYVKQAVAVHQPELAQRLIDKAREWYQYSKAIEQAQDYVNQQ